MTVLQDFGQSSLSADDLLQVASDVTGDAICVQPPQLTSSATCLTTIDVPVPVLSVCATSVEMQSTADIVVRPADHSYHHPSKRKHLDRDAESAGAAKHAQYLERRRKNNVASKRSRETRRHRQMDMEEELTLLEQRNARLRQSVVELERVTQTMKSALVDALREASSS